MHIFSFHKNDPDLRKRVESAHKNIVKMAQKLDVSHLASPVYENPAFLDWSGSSKPEQHHYGCGGLIIHTNEVINLCFQSFKTLGLQPNKQEQQILFLSCLYHDYGKIWDYTYTDIIHSSMNIPENWTGTNHKRRIHHISRSAIEWNIVASNQKVPELFRDDITHNILSHHGQREWGSPVMPLSKLAWLLHLCDGISARMDDANKNDLVKNIK